MRGIWQIIRKTSWKTDFWHVSEEQGGNIPPPLLDFRITQLNDIRITMAGDNRRTM